MSNKAFVEITFNNEVEDYFKKLVNQLVPEKFLYSSDVVSHIRGNMANSLHLTLFFGLENYQIDNPEINKIINSTTFKEIKLGKLFFFEGYENLYRVLCVEVLDEDKKLFNLSKKFESFAPDREPKEFKPHLTLAYVTNDYEIPVNLPKIKVSIPVEKLQITKVSDFLKRINS